MPSQNDRAVVEAVAREAAAEIDNVALRAELARQVELSASPVPARHRTPRGAPTHRARPPRRRAAAAAGHRPSAPVGQGQRADERAPRRGRPGRRRARRHRPGAARPGRRPAARRAGRWWSARRGGGPGRPHPAETSATTSSTSASLRSIEGAAWFVIAEGVANAVKHAAVDDVSITVTPSARRPSGRRRRRGVGGADPRAAGCRVSPTGSRRSAGLSVG